MQRIIVFIGTLLLGIHVNAQFETDYKPITSKGKLPADFVTLSSKKYEAQKAALTKKEKENDRKATEQFLLASNYSLDELLLSGKVLFNDPLSEYVNKVADELLKSDPATRSKLRFYVLKSTAVNAFATNQGVIFVTMGMLGQIENEAQLAYVLAHEVVHYKEKHAVKQHLEEDKIDKGKGSYKRLAEEQQLLSKCAFSQDQEKEADEKGLQIFLKSKYSTAKVGGVYDVLKFSYLPFDDVKFDKDFLENQTLKFPERYYIEETRPVDVNAVDEDDEESTHPSITSRREKFLASIEGIDNSGKSDNWVGEKEFTRARETARFELSRLYTISHRYEMGIYNSYLLLRKYPKNLYLKKNVAYCLAGLAKYSNENEFSEVHGDEQKIEGKSQALFYLMHKLDSVAGDLNIVAQAYVTRLKKDFPNDQDIDYLYKDLLRALVKEHKLYYSSFSSTPPSIGGTADTPIVKAVVEKDTVSAGKSKYEKLREQKTDPENPTTVSSSSRFSMYAFVEFMKEDWFKKDFEDAVTQNKEKKSVSLKEEPTGKKKKRKKVKPFALGVKRVVIVDPYYARINARNEESFRYLKSEAGQVDLTERVKTNAKKAKVEAEVLTTKNLKEADVEKMNDIAVMTEYITDQLNHDENVDMPYVEKERVRAIAAKYKTDYFMWTGVVSFTDKVGVKPLAIVMAILIPPFIPILAPNMINAGQYTYYFSLLYDVKTDEIKMAVSREIQSRTQPAILNSHIYDIFNQIKTPPKK